MATDDPLATGCDLFYEAWGHSPTWRRIWEEHVTGSDFPYEFAHVSFISMLELRGLAAGLNLAAGQLLVDLDRFEAGSVDTIRTRRSTSASATALVAPDERDRPP